MITRVLRLLRTRQHLRAQKHESQSSGAPEGGWPLADDVRAALNGDGSGGEVFFHNTGDAR